MLKCDVLMFTFDECNIYMVYKISCKVYEDLCIDIYGVLSFAISQ